jgi:hypothetical protein
MVEISLLAIKIVLAVTAFDLFVLLVLALSARFHGFQRDRPGNAGRIRTERDSYQRVLRSVSSSLASPPVGADGKGAVPTH